VKLDTLENVKCVAGL